MTGSSGVTLALAALAALTVGAAAFGSDPPTAAAFVAATTSGRSNPGTAPECPLTPLQERRAVNAFQELMPVLTHPRCFNCHGGVNPYVARNQGGHAGGRMIGPNGRGSPPIRQCQECHDGLPSWDTPLPDFFFVGKSPRELCMQFKSVEIVGSSFVRHVQSDPFTKTAFIGDRALNNASQYMAADARGIPFANQPPPGSHAQFNAQAQAWVDAVGAGWRIMPDCGCGREVKPWVGTVNAVFEIDLGPGSLGTLIETDSATVRFEIDSSFTVTGYWKSVSGAIKWTTSATGGACTGGGSGTVPIGLGSDQNPMAGLHLDYGSGGLRFIVGIGPWPDPYMPVIKYFCKDAPWLGVFSLLGAMQWWSHPPEGGAVSPDGKTIKGTYTTALSTGTMVWTWDLRLVP